MRSALRLLIHALEGDPPALEVVTEIREHARAVCGEWLAMTDDEWAAGIQNLFPPAYLRESRKRRGTKP
jgi:hypothetical protein